MQYSTIKAVLATALLSLPSALAQVTVFRDIDFSGPQERLIFTPEECSTYSLCTCTWL